MRLQASSLRAGPPALSTPALSLLWMCAVVRLPAVCHADSGNGTTRVVRPAVQDGTWAGYMEVVAASRCLGANLTIYQVGWGPQGPQECGMPGVVCPVT